LPILIDKIIVPNVVIPFLKSDATVDRAYNLFYIDLN